MAKVVHALRTRAHLVLLTVTSTIRAEGGILRPLEPRDAADLLTSTVEPEICHLTGSHAAFTPETHRTRMR